MAYFRGQGKMLIATRDALGNPGPFRFVGNVPELSSELATDVEEHKESQTGQGLTDLRLIKGKSSTLKFKLEQFDRYNLALRLYGADSVIAAGTVTAEALPDAIVAGDIIRLQKPKASSIVVTDSAGAPATLTEGTNYSIYSAEHGSLQFLDVSGLTQPFNVDYANAQAINVNMLSQSVTEYWVRFEGLNTADSNKPVLVEYYRFSPDPAKTLALITDNIDSPDVEGSVLYDETKAADPVLGQFGRVVLL